MTIKLQLLSIMDLVNAKPVLLVMMLQDAVSQLLLVAPSYKVWCAVWTTKMLMLVMKLKPREVSSTLNIQLITVSSTIGTIWNVSGIMLSSMNSELPQMSTQPFLLRPHKTQRPIVKKWPKSFSKPSTYHHSMLLSKPYFLSMPQEEPQVSSSILEMVSHTQSQSMKVMPFHTPSNVLILLVVLVPIGSLRSLWNLVCHSHHQLKEKSSEISKKSSLMLLLTMKLN